MEIRINNKKIKINNKVRFIIASVTLIIYLIISFQGEYIYYLLHPSMYSLYKAEIVRIETTEPVMTGSIGRHRKYASFIHTCVKVNEEYYEVKHKLGDKVGEQIMVAINDTDKNKCTRNEYLFLSYNSDATFYEPTILIAAICLYIVWLFFLILDRPESDDISRKPVDIRLYNLEQYVVHRKKENKNYIKPAKNFYNIFQKPLPDELIWIFKWSDLSQFDETFLFGETDGNYDFVHETLELRTRGLPENYIVFRKAGTNYYAICFEDEKVYSFTIQKIDELQCVGAFYLYIIDYVKGALVE